MEAQLIISIDEGLNVQLEFRLPLQGFFHFILDEFAGGYLHPQLSGQQG
jgi:hypothetical protein